MSAMADLQTRWRQARVRRLVLPLGLGLPPLLAVAWAWPGGRWACLLASLGLLWWGLWRARALDRYWLARQLDARVPALEDSSALLLQLEPARSRLGLAQRERLLARLPGLSLPDLRPPWPRMAQLASVLAAAALLLILPQWRTAPLPETVGVVPSAGVAHGRSVVPSLRGLSLRVEPPAYTGLPAEHSSRPELQAVVGSLLHWQLQLEGLQACPDCNLQLRFHDDSTLPLQSSESGLWQASRRLSEDSYYRIELDGRPMALIDVSGGEDRGPWRLSAIADQPPRIEVIEPQRTLTVLEQAQARWPLAFEISDDHGLGQAELLVTLAQGSGEQITVSERRLRLRGEGDARHQRLTHRIDPAALGFAQGDDLIVRLEVSDRAEPAPQRSRSASYILRWPARRGAEASGVEISVQRAMPAYFRSQRQLIIDTEALIAERYNPPASQPALAAEPFAERADALGVDQRILRLRYGQFLGEEAEGAPTAELQGRVAGLLADQAHDDAHADHDHADHAHDAHEHDELGHDEAGHSAPAAAPASDSHADHDHGAEPGLGSAQVGFGSAIRVLEEYGHTHDDAEATTLFDPATRALLRRALDAMWQSELALRQAQPRASLPHQYQALELIKQVQQSTRIYLARVGLELPPIDFSRRLSGETAGLARPADRLTPADRDLAVRQWWQASGEGSRPAAGLMDELRAWLADRDSPEVDDPLALLAAAERWSSDADCERCRQAWRQALWPLLPPARMSAGPRPQPDVLGAVWLQRAQQLAPPATAGQAAR